MMKANVKEALKRLESSARECVYMHYGSEEHESKLRELSITNTKGDQ